jgi:hypothetical protein
MTVRELRDTLDRAGIRPRAYDFDSSNRDEVYCLEETQGGWVVYYRERGIRRDEQLFSSEDEACKHILALLVRDPTTRL